MERRRRPSCKPAPVEVALNPHPDPDVREGELILDRLLARPDHVAGMSDRVCRGVGPRIAPDRLQDDVDPVGRPLSGPGDTHPEVIGPRVARVAGDVLDLVVGDLGMRLSVHGRRDSETPSARRQGLSESQVGLPTCSSDRDSARCAAPTLQTDLRRANANPDSGPRASRRSGCGEGGPRKTVRSPNRRGGRGERPGCDRPGRSTR